MSFRLAAAGLVLFALGLVGCSHYRLGTGSEGTFATLHIEPVQVEARLPQAQPLLGTQLREAFLRDSRVRLVGGATDADAVLTVVVDGYDRAVATVQPNDTGLARRFDVALRARATLTERGTGRTLFANRPFEVRRGVFTDSGLGPAEFHNLPLLAEDLARVIRSAVLDTW